MTVCARRSVIVIVIVIGWTNTLFGRTNTLYGWIKNKKKIAQFKYLWSIYEDVLRFMSRSRGEVPRGNCTFSAFTIIIETNDVITAGSVGGKVLRQEVANILERTQNCIVLC